MVNTKTPLEGLTTKQLIDELIQRSEQRKLSADDVQILDSIIESEVQGMDQLPKPKEEELTQLVSMAFTAPYFVKELTKKIYKKPSPELRRMLLKHLKLNFRDEWIQLAEKYKTAKKDKPTT